MNRDYKTLEITTLYEISKLLGSSLNLKANLRGVMRLLSEYLDMKRGTVALRQNSEVSIVAAYGMTEEEIRKGRYKLGEGIIGRVAKLGSPIVVPDIGDEPLFLNKTGARKLVKKENISFLCVPIKIKHEVLGVLSVDRLFESKISFEEDLRLLKIIASLIAYTVKLHFDIEKEREAYREEKEVLTQQLKSRYHVKGIIGQSDRMQEVFEAVYRIAPTRATVLLRGESGTGKELIAKAIHYMSPRAAGPFIKLNCASIPEGLLESELFGHEKGAFTGATVMRRGKFELAQGGTIFLDEIGDLPLVLQPKILRILQEREFERIGSEKTLHVDVRLVAATSKNLEDLVSKGAFRDDLYYRLNVIPVFLPPLRERRDDIPVLVDYFLQKYSKENGKTLTISPGVLTVLKNCDWPGNVRELENTLERLVVMTAGKVVTMNDLPLSIKSQPLKTQYGAQGSEGLVSVVESIERTYIMDALQKSGWNHAKAARALGITSRQIGYKINKYALEQK